MHEKKSLTAQDCSGLSPRMFVVNHGAGETLSPQVREWLDPVDSGSLHHWDLAAVDATALHYHDFDEYWLWTRGETRLTIRLPDGRSDTFGIGPGWAVYCVRGVEHGHQPCTDWGCYEFTAQKREGIGSEHRFRQFD